MYQVWSIWPRSAICTMLAWERSPAIRASSSNISTNSGRLDSSGRMTLMA